MAYNTPEKRARHREEQRLYKLRHPEKVVEAKRAWRKRNPRCMKEWRKTHTEKHLAHKAVDNAVQSGRLIKPGACSRCGKSFTQAEIHAHHEDYKKRLEVIWVCVQCHAYIHEAKKVKP